MIELWKLRETQIQIRLQIQIQMHHLLTYLCPKKLANYKVRVVPLCFVCRQQLNAATCRFAMSLELLSIYVHNTNTKIHKYTNIQTQIQIQIQMCCIYHNLMWLPVANLCRSNSSAYMEGSLSVSMCSIVFQLNTL